MALVARFSVSKDRSWRNRRQRRSLRYAVGCMNIAFTLQYRCTSRAQPTVTGVHRRPARGAAAATAAGAREPSRVVVVHAAKTQQQTRAETFRRLTRWRSSCAPAPCPRS